MSPAEGIVLQTIFTITCQDFTDVDAPLTFSLYGGKLMAGKILKHTLGSYSSEI